MHSKSAAESGALCPIVGIGGSAGGFEATSELLRHLPAKSGMAFVIVQHLDPHHASRLADLLGKMTAMPVTELTGPTEAQPNTIYIQPPNKCVIVKDGMLALIRRTQRMNLTIDHFFESLAEQRGPRAIGVILSGTGSDGTAGLRAIKAAGGLTFAQDIETAKFPDMPRNAIRSGFADCVLSPKELGREVVRIVKHPYIRRPMPDGEDGETATTNHEEIDGLSQIFTSLKRQVGVDFTNYKPATLHRRIQRRMALHRITTLDNYAHFACNREAEIEALFNDLLINVTRFFRDTALFRALQKRLLPALLKNKKGAGELRAWVPGCATGEEVYSLAICILEALGKHAAEMRIQIFGTDLGEAMIDHARAGVYSSAIEKDVSAKRLQRFFVKRDGTYQITRHVREVCTFARQNVVTDPPFSRLDIISCRNVLIYLGPDLHTRCIPQFHHALNPGGYLILGPAESIGPFEKLFETVDGKNKIFAKKMVPMQLPVDLYPRPEPRLGVLPPRMTEREAASFTAQLLQMADRIMLSAYAPAAVVIDRDMHVHQFRGRTDLYLEHAPGPASLNLLELVRPSIVSDLRNAIRRAIKLKKPTRKERAVVKIGNRPREINIQVVPFKIASSERPWMLVIFDETTLGTQPGKKPGPLGKTATQREIAELRRDLSASKESLQAIIEEQEATNEELKSANEEVESSNEELQSAIEELETTKEELQSSNEELTTLNDELTNRNFEMVQLNRDFSSLLDSVQLPIVMVDSNLIVRRATPAARTAFNVLPTDVGRPISDLKSNVDVINLEKILRDVIETLSSHTRRVSDQDGRKYSLRIRPYRTSDNKIDGAVMTLIDLDAKKEADGNSKNKGAKEIQSLA